MNIDSDDFFQHFGVKGMKWGVRRANTSSSNSGSGGTRSGTTAAEIRRQRNAQSRTKEQEAKRQRNKNIAVGVAAATAGAAVATLVMQRSGKKQLRSLEQATNPFSVTRTNVGGKDGELNVARMKSLANTSAKWAEAMEWERKMILESRR